MVNIILTTISYIYIYTCPYQWFLVVNRSHQPRIRSGHWRLLPTGLRRGDLLLRLLSGSPRGAIDDLSC